MEQVINKEYEIAGKVFYQKKLVLGQIKQISKELTDFVFPEELNVVSIFKLLGGKASKVISIILIEDGVSLKDKNVDSVEEFIDENIEYDMALEILKDFFLVNTISHIPEVISKIIETMSANTVKNQ